MTPFNPEEIVTLFIEDVSTISRSLWILLHQFGYCNFAFAIRSEEAIRLLHARKDINLVIMDYFLPGISGTELIAAIRKDVEFSKEIRIILITDGQFSQNSVTMALRVGANACLPRSASAQELHNTIAQIFQPPSS